MAINEQIEYWIKELPLEKEIFLVEVEISKSGVISVFIDSNESVTISDCSKASRFLQEKIVDLTEKYQLIVSSSGLDRPLKISEQFKKNIGKEVSVLLKNGEKKIGILSSYSSDFLGLQIVKVKKKKDNSNAENEELLFSNNDISKVKVLVSFKQ